MAKSFNAANHQSTLRLIPFVSPSEDNVKNSITSDSSIETGLSGEEVSQFYNSVISAPSSQVLKKHSALKSKKTPSVSTGVKLSSDSIFRFAQEGKIEQIKKCVAAGYSVDQQDAYGWTPLMCAACEGHSEIVEYLLKEGANPDIKCKSGMTPLDIALKKKNNIIIQLLESGTTIEEPLPSCSTIKQSIKEKYCDSCKVRYKVSTITHDRSIAHLLNTKKTKLSTFYHIPENNKGFQIMLKKGWDKNKGLGVNAEGRKFPIKTVLKRDRACIGKTKEVAKVTHFDAHDNAAVKAPKHFSIRTVREKTLKKWQRKKVDEISRQREINFRRQFNCDF